MLPTNKIGSDAIQKWVVDSVHPEASILDVKQLQGGVSSLVHSITLVVNLEVQTVVLRQFDNVEWVTRQPDLALQEAKCLLRASKTIGVKIPELIAIEESGSAFDTPAVLMTLLEGRVILEPEDAAGWVNGMAQALTLIHKVETNEFQWTYAAYADVSTLDTSSWSKVPDKWQLAANIVKGSRPQFVKRFIHRDYHPANILWHNGKVSGIVDWVNGCIGPAGIDVGHCRVNLALLHNVQLADDFLNSYQEHAGIAFAYDPYWDLVTLIDFAYWQPEVYRGWTDLGMTGLTIELIIERLDSYLLSLLDRVLEGEDANV